MLTQVTVCVDGIPYDVAIHIDRDRLMTRAHRSPAGGPWMRLLFIWPQLDAAVRREASRRGLFDQAREYHAALAREFDAERAAHPERFISGADQAQKEEQSCLESYHG